MTTAVYVGPTGREVSLDDNDILWAARGCEGESRGRASRERCAGYLWAIMRRLHLMFPRIRSYGQLWLEFSQPIKPDWQADGKFCRPGGKYAGTKYCRADLLEYRAMVSKMPYADISPTIRRAVEDFAKGALPPPAFERKLPAKHRRVSNWGSYENVEKAYPQGIRFEGEWFLQDANLLAGDVVVKGAPDWSDDRPTIALVSWAGVGLVVAASIGAYLMFKG